MRTVLRWVKGFLKKNTEDHLGAYASQAAYFIVLSAFPFCIFLLTLLRYSPLTYEDLLNILQMLSPKMANDVIRTVMKEVYEQSTIAITSFTIIFVLWSAGRGILSITRGINEIYHINETRNYFYLRARACLYTFLFLVAIMLSLVLSVFGNSISVIVYEHAPFLSKVIHKIVQLRIYFTLPLLTFFWDLVYKFLPNRGAAGKTTLRKQLPGAFFTACGWMALSFIFSIYLDIFKGFTNMYGSFTTIILVMLWLYGCMYIILLGGEINAILEGFRSRRS